MPSDAERIMALFSGNDTHYGTHGQPDLDPIGGMKWEIGRTAKTLRGTTTIEMWERHLSGKKPLGVVPIRTDNTVVFGSIDIDDYDVNVSDVITKIETMKLPLLVCRSKSGGLHLWLFLSGPTSAELVQSTLRDVAAAIGYAKCEIFPKQTKILADKGDMGSWMVMPYFGSTYDGKLKEQVGIKKTGAEMTIREFLSAAERMRVAPGDLSLIRVKKPKKERAPFGDGPPCLVHLAAAGIPQGGQNNALFHMGVYFKRANPEDWKERLEDANQKFCRPPHPADKLSSVMKSLEKKEYQYKCKDQPMESHCDAIACRGRKFGVGAGGTYPQITHVSKLNTEPPIWFVTVEGVRMSMSTTELQDYRAFHRICMDNTHKSFAPIPPQAWFGIVNEALANLEVIPAPDEIGVAGQFREILSTYLTNRQRGKEREDLLDGRPWEDEENSRHYFKLGPFQRFLEREGMKELSRHRGMITTRIEKLGGGNHPITHPGGKHRSYWFVPSDALEAEDVLETPKIQGGEM